MMMHGPANVKITYLLIYWLIPWIRVLLEKQTGSQLVKKFTAFFGTRKLITAVYNCSSPVPILSQINPVHSFSKRTLLCGFHRATTTCTFHEAQVEL